MRHLLKKDFIGRVCLILLLLAVFVFISAFSYANTVSDEIADSVFRLHVIANSNSDEDQNLKYKVRDALIEYMNSICSNTTTKEEAINIAKAHIDAFYDIANNVIEENGFSYPVNIEIGEFDFPTKTYGDVSLPAGTYDALEVKIGEAVGQNWWCVMFPPLCFVDVSSGIVPDDSKEQLEESMPEEDYDLITKSDDSSDVHFKFKIVELFENLKMKLASN